MAVTLAASGAMELVKRLLAATRHRAGTPVPAPTPLPCSKEKAMLQFLRRLTGPFRSRRTGMPS